MGNRAAKHSAEHAITRIAADDRRRCAVIADGSRGTVLSVFHPDVFDAAVGPVLGVAAEDVVGCDIAPRLGLDAVLPRLLGTPSAFSVRGFAAGGDVLVVGELAEQGGGGVCCSAQHWRLWLLLPTDAAAIKAIERPPKPGTVACPHQFVCSRCRAVSLDGCVYAPAATVLLRLLREGHRTLHRVSASKCRGCRAAERPTVAVAEELLHEGYDAPDAMSDDGHDGGDADAADDAVSANDDAASSGVAGLSFTPTLSFAASAPTHTPPPPLPYDRSAEERPPQLTIGDIDVVSGPRVFTPRSALRHAAATDGTAPVANPRRSPAPQRVRFKPAATKLRVGVLVEDARVGSQLAAAATGMGGVAVALRTSVAVTADTGEHLVVVDVAFTREPGLDAVRLLRRRLGNAVALLAIGRSGAFSEAAVAAGADAFLLLPCDDVQLRRVLYDLLPLVVRR